MPRSSPTPLARITIATTAVLAVMVAATLLGVVPVRPGVAADEPNAVEQQVDAALRALPLADRAAQLVVTSVPGTTLAARDARVLAANRFGGVILFRDNYRARRQVTAFTRAIRAAGIAGHGSGTRPRPLVSVDQEGGVVRRFPDVAPFRSHPRLGSAATTTATVAQGRAAAATLASLGVQLNLAPVADLDLAPYRLMRERSFGRDPQRVADHVAAFVSGAHQGKGGVVVKHFPGFGAARVNSDDAPVSISRTLPQLRAADLVPFVGAIEAGTDGVMISHARYTSIDARRPASTSPAIYRLLREEFDYDGLAVTDALHAQGFGFPIGAGCVRVVSAGADIALLTGTLADAVACRRALILSARRSAALRARIDESVRRVLRFKARVGLLPS